MNKQIENLNFPISAKEYINNFKVFLTHDINSFEKLNSSINLIDNSIYEETSSNNPKANIANIPTTNLGSGLINSEPSYSGDKETIVNYFRDEKLGHMSIPMMLYLFSFIDLVGFLTRDKIINQEVDNEGNFQYTPVKGSGEKPHSQTSENIDNFLELIKDEIQGTISKKKIECLKNNYRHGLVHLGFPKRGFKITTKSNFKIIENNASKVKSEDLICREPFSTTIIIYVDVWAELVLKSLAKWDIVYESEKDEIEKNYNYLVDYLNRN